MLLPIYDVYFLCSIIIYIPVWRVAPSSTTAVAATATATPTPTSTPDNSDHLITEDEASEPEMIRLEEEEEFDTLEESSISFRLSGPNERLSRND